MAKVNLSNNTILIICLLLSNLIFLIDLYTPLGITMGVLYVVVILLSLLSSNRKDTLSFLIISSMFIVLGYFLSHTHLSNQENLINRCVALFLVMLTTLLGYQIKRSSDILRHSRFLFQNFMDHSPAVAFMKDAQGFYTFINKPFEKAFHVKNSQLKGKTDFDFLPADVAETLLKNDRYVQETGKVLETVEHVPTPDGQMRSWVVFKFPFYDAQNRFFLGGAALDMTEHYSIQEQLKINEKKFRSLIENSSDMIALVDAKGSIQYASASTQRILGYPIAEYTGQNIFDFMTKDDSQLTQNHFKKILQDPKESIQGESRMRHKDGSLRTIEWNAKNLFADASIQAIILNYRDVTERRQAEEAKSYLAAIVDSSEDAIYGETLDGIITSWNKGAEKVYGYSAQEAIGYPIYKLAPEYKFEEIAELLKKVQQGDHIKSYETIRRHKDGRLIAVSLTLSPIFNTQGKLVGTSCIARDITARKHAEAQLKRQKDRAQQYLNIAEVMIIAFNAHGEVNLVNKKGLNVLGYSEKEILGRSWVDMFVPVPLRLQIKDMLLQWMRNDAGHQEYIEYPIIIKSGQERLIAWHKVILRDEEGKVTDILCSGEDITERRHAEEDLKEINLALSNAMPGVARLDAQGHFIFMNEVFLEMFHAQKSDFLNRFWMKTIHVDDQSSAINAYKEMLINGKAEFEARAIRKDGTAFYQRVLLVKRVDKSNDFTGYHCFVRDISQSVLIHNNLRMLKEKLELEKTKLEQVLSIEENLSRIVNMDKLIDFVIDKTAELLEAQKCSLVMIDENTGEMCIKGLKGFDAEVIRGNGALRDDPIVGELAKRGKPLLVSDLTQDLRFNEQEKKRFASRTFVSAPIKLENNLIGAISVADKNSRDAKAFAELDLKILCMIVSQVAIAIENAKLYRELGYLSITDPLTGLYNYRYFIKSLEYEIKRMKRTHRPLCLLMIDIDDFKAHNDSLGHLEGDNILKNMSQIFRQNLRETDIICRYAGDEFVIILPETEVQQAKGVAEKIILKSDVFPFKKKITLSVGVTLCRPEMERYDVILKADTALYGAKREGKNRVVVHA